MPALPGRPVFLHCRQHLLSGRRHQLRIQFRPLDRDRIDGLADHGLDCFRSAKGFDGFRMPCGALLGQAAGFVLGVAGLQGGLLG